MAESKEYGQPIDLNEAINLINEHKKLRDNIKMESISSSQAGDPDLGKKTGVFLNQKYNAFVFTKDLIMRFLDGSEKDDFGNPQASNYLVVILGAHPEKKVIDDEEFDAGSFTVLTAGCRRVEEIVKGKKVIKFYPLSIPKPANEYPPRTYITLEPMSDKITKENSTDAIETYFLQTNDPHDL